MAIDMWQRPSGSSELTAWAHNVYLNTIMALLSFGLLLVNQMHQVHTVYREHWYECGDVCVMAMHMFTWLKAVQVVQIITVVTYQASRWSTRSLLQRHLIHTARKAKSTDRFSSK